MNEQKIQRCSNCDEPTGRCEDDSIYVGESNSIGPLCEDCHDCYERLQKKIQQAITKQIDGAERVPVTEYGTRLIVKAINDVLVKYVPKKKFEVRVSENQKYTPEERRRLAIGPIIEVVEVAETITLSFTVEL